MEGVSCCGEEGCPGVTGGKIMIIEDNQVIVELLERRISRQGYSVVTCLDSEAALRVCREEKPDLVILDILMPGKSGWEIMEDLKSNPDTASIPIIVSTVKNRPEDVEKARELQAADYIAKPYVFSDLLERIERVLGGRKAGPEGTQGP
ncbi:response regulator [Candidatus Solincola tengchongensis]|uniref:response regulator n=1 Tax=Candidatus Solincola tengchongensis TaxID=2900693 RepID=UPI00257DD110|nr:response regulator [Candidatus Solincola tengchongensis]